MARNPPGLSLVSDGPAAERPTTIASSRDAVGRRQELELLGSFLDRVAVQGEALLLWGEPGVGKTLLLDVAAKSATTAGMRVLRAAGVEFEAEMSFAGLNQALLPLLGEFVKLSATHRDALNVALGFGEGPSPDRLVVSTATLALLQQAGAGRPLLLIVDDLPWLDRASAGVLGFVARRLNGSRIGFLVASQSGRRASLSARGFPSTCCSRSTPTPRAAYWGHASQRWRRMFVSACWRRRRETRWPFWSFPLH